MSLTLEAPDAAAARPAGETVADLVERLGGIPLERILIVPPPGTATVEDVAMPREGARRLCELVDGTLVVKAMGFDESVLTVELIQILGEFVRRHDLGRITGPDATLNILPGQVRLPDVSFISWSRLPGRKRLRKAVPSIAPDLAIEVLSKSNTRAEMDRKVRDYFAAGVRMVWLVDPRSQTARSYTGPEEYQSVPEDGALDGGEVLPGFTLSLREWFERAGEDAEEE